MRETEEVTLYEEKGRLIFWPYYFKVYQDRIEAYFSPHKQVIPILDIESVEILEKIPFWSIGRGLRYGIRGTKHRGTKYFALRGTGIRLKLKSGRWKKVVLSVKDPEKVKSIIEERLAQSEPETSLDNKFQGKNKELQISSLTYFYSRFSYCILWSVTR